MMTSVIVRDESISGEMLQELTVEIPSENLTVNELIRSRVYQEVKESNARKSSKTRDNETPSHVQPTQDELALNGPRTKEPSLAQWQAQFEKAVSAFRANRIMVLINDKQVYSLDEPLKIESDTKISFLRLNMLMGG